jgi:hypothetical protein
MGSLSMNKRVAVYSAVTLFILIFIVFIFAFRPEQVPAKLVGKLYISHGSFSSSDPYKAGNHETLNVNCQKHQSFCKRIVKFRIEKDKQNLDVKSATGLENHSCEEYSINGTLNEKNFWINETNCYDNPYKNNLKKLKNIINEEFDSTDWRQDSLN